MKTTITILTVLFTVLFTNLTSAQNFKGNASASYGLFSPSIIMQYEASTTNDRISLGVNMNYYLQNWKGPLFNYFVRGYKSSTEEGFFLQASATIGNLTTLGDAEEDLIRTIENKRSFVYGGEFGMGRKYLIGKHFTVEALITLRVLSRPNNRYSDGQYNYFIDDQTMWLMSVGTPLGGHIAVGYQF